MTNWKKSRTKGKNKLIQIEQAEYTEGLQLYLSLKNGILLYLKYGEEEEGME